MFPWFVGCVADWDVVIVKMVKEKINEIEKKLRKIEKKLKVPSPEKFTKLLKKGTGEILQILDQTIREITPHHKKKEEK